MFLVRIFPHNHAGGVVVISYLLYYYYHKIKVHFLVTKSSQVQIVAFGVVPIFHVGG